MNFLDEAIKEARKAALKGEVPVGAVVVCDGKIVARGRNQREIRQTVLGHAELAAVVKAEKKLGSWRLADCDVYVTLEPCPMCAGALQQSRVRKVYFGVYDPKAGVMSLGININNNPKLNHRFEMSCLEVAECGELLSEFFRARRKSRAR